MFLKSKSVSHFLLTTVCLGMILGNSGLLQAQKARGILVEKVQNDRSSFYVRVDVDRKDRTYLVGDTAQISVVSGKPGYLYLFYIQADKSVVCLFPNKIQKENYIHSKTKIVIPAQDDQFRLRIAEPTGTEVLKAIVTKQPLKSLDLKQLTNSNFTSINGNKAKAIVVESTENDSKDWAAHQVVIKTMTSKSDRNQNTHSQPKRVALVIGISVYKDSRINSLRICHKDANNLGMALKKHGDFDEVFILTNEAATLENIRKAIHEKLASITRAGDEVLIFWSGHGDSVADVDGDEKDGFDELLIPYDANLENILETSVSDDRFGHWLQALDGRKIVVVLDACKSGGQANNEKSLKIKGFDFLEGELARTKDIGQKQAAVLASSHAAQVSLVRREGDLSVMTYFLIEKLRSSDRKISLQDMYQYVLKKVPEYMKQNHPGYPQTPVLIGYEGMPFHFKK
jgi:Caspase domain/Domain of unknown function (DUF4384)